MKKIVLFVLYGALCLLFAKGIDAQGGPKDRDIVQNGGFEVAQGEQGPAKWNFVPAKTGDKAPSWKWESNGGINGSGCVTGGVAALGDVGSWSQTNLTVPKDAPYLRVTVYVKSRGLRTCRGFVGITFKDKAGAPIGEESQICGVSTNRDWTKHMESVKAPKGARTFDVRLGVWYAFTKCGNLLWDNLSVEPATEPVKNLTVYRDENTPPAPTAMETERGFLLFSRGINRVVFPNTVPAADERITSLSIAAAPGEREPAVVVVRALRNLKKVKISTGALSGKGESIPASALEIRSVRFQPAGGQERWGIFNQTVMENVPRILEQIDTRDIAAEKNQPFWITVHVPEDTPAGGYTGAVMIKVGNKTITEIPLTLNVRPIRLPKPKGVMFAMYDAQMVGSLPWIDDKFADLRAHGMTSVAFCGNSGLAIKTIDGRPTIAWKGHSLLEIYLDACIRHGLTEPALWLMGEDIKKFCLTAGPLESDAFAQSWRTVISEIVAHGKTRGWPEIIFQVVDEPYEVESRLALNTRLLKLTKSVPGVRAEGDGMNGKWENFTPDSYALTDVMTLHDGPMLDRHSPVDMPKWWEFQKKAKADGKRLWFYGIDLTAWHPEPVRYMSGFGLWKSGADGVIEWSYMSQYGEKDAGKAYKELDPLIFRYPKAPGEPGGTTVGYEAIREGIDDYRYLLALREAVDKAKASGNPRKADLAKSLWDKVQARLDRANFNGCKGVAMQGDWTGTCEALPDGTRIVRGDHKTPNGWGFEEYDELRTIIAESIVQLK